MPAAKTTRDLAAELAVLDRCLELAALHAHVRAFAQLITERRDRELEKWINATSSQPGLGSFINGLRRDQDAVTAGLSVRWNSGPVDGHIDRIKMIKRQMYGRASPDLLRRRVLLAH
jgi:transposase